MDTVLQQFQTGEMMTWVKRSPMTEKKRRAIGAYVRQRCATSALTIENAINYTLTAEKMPAHVLYALLERRGYKWHSGIKQWVNKKRAG